MVLSNAELAERLARRVVVADDGCHIWQGAVCGGKEGRRYGSLTADYKKWLVHRLAYVLAHGSIPEGMTIDHLCRKSLCCNPSHLEAVTLKENILRGEGVFAKAKRRTHCPKGHELSGDNLIASARNRECRTCSYARHAEYKRRRRAAKTPA